MATFDGRLLACVVGMALVTACGSDDTESGSPASGGTAGTAGAAGAAGAGGGLAGQAGAAGAGAPLCPDPLPAAWIFCDDFESGSPVFTYAPGTYDEAGGDFGLVDSEAHSGTRSMEAHLHQAQVNGGSMWVTFGKNPFGSQFRSTEDFTEIYWRMWVKHQAGWVSEPGNLSLSKIVSMVSSDLSQAMFAGLGSEGDVLGSGPGSCVNGDQIICSGLNDPTNTKWLPGLKGSAPIFSSTDTGTWRCVEAHVALNTPGEKDGVLEFWVDEQLDASANDLDFRGSYTGHGLNALFFFNWYSQGSPADQRRWMDDIVIATERIGCD